MNIDELIEAFEAATGPNRELDARIRKAAFGDFGFCGDHEGATWCGGCANDDCGAPVGMCDDRKSLPSDWRDDECLPRYSASIDAALTLGGSDALALLDEALSAVEMDFTLESVGDQVRALPQYICLAALKARRAAQ